MMSEGFLALSAVVVGWLLARYDDRVMYRRRVKEIRARILSDLLDVRSRLVSNAYIVTRIRGLLKEFRASEEDAKEMLRAVPDGLLWDKDIGERYKQAVSDLAAYEPLASWVLRSQSSIIDVQQWLLLAPDSESDEEVQFAQDMREKIEENAIPVIDETIRGLSSNRGRTTRARIEEVIGGGSKPSKEFEQFADQLIGDISRRIRLSDVAKPVDGHTN